MVITINHPIKKTKGRRKIEIKPIEAKSNLQVTFSKRRSGLIKKASELSLLCGVHVALITFSPGNKAFSFGHPNVDSVINQYLNQNPGDLQSEDDPTIRQCTAEYIEAAKDIVEDEKEFLAAIRENNHDLGVFWWDNINIDGLGLEELEDYMKAMMELKMNVDFRVNELMINANHHFGFGGDHVGDSFVPFGAGTF
ncbi:Agamous-like MADS-box protein AGL62 [Euphorbia peplus]|nr:Agamous-like MADS-box protein AGL62 [Euphorbia peplus]